MPNLLFLAVVLSKWGLRAEDPGGDMVQVVLACLLHMYSCGMDKSVCGCVRACVSVILLLLLLSLLTRLNT